MIMKKLFLCLLAGLLTGTPVMANDDNITRGYNTMDAMGCMLLRECTDNVRQIKTLKDFENIYPDTNYSVVGEEIEELLFAFNKIGIKVFIAPEKYFPVNHRGVYHTVGNNFFLNEDYMAGPATLISVMRHEGWHAAQDCMAGSIDNSVIAVIKPMDEVPMIWRELAERTYAENVVPWEAEAWWAGKTKGMTVDALNACATGAMWDQPGYEPTPLTRQYLIDEGFIK